MGSTGAMKSLPFAVILISATAFVAGQNLNHSQDAELNSGRMGPTMILWNTGLVETIAPALLDHRPVWRITHYPLDPTGTTTNEYDLYDLDQKTLAPLRSVMNTEEFHLDLTFTEKTVILHKTAVEGDKTENIPLSSTVQPEGPGLDVFVSSLPLRPGYKIQYFIVDRWSGNGSTRLKRITLSVLDRANENTLLGQRDILDVLIKPEDGSFQIKEKILAQMPHFPVKVEYTREGKTYPPSEVVAIIH